LGKSTGGGRKIYGAVVTGESENLRVRGKKGTGKSGKVKYGGAVA